MKILLKPSDDVAFDDLHLEKEPRNGDELYERWRASFIKRHICADGKVDENTFLIERDSHVVIERKDFSRRHRREIWSGKNATSANLLTPQTKTWWPVSTESSQKSRNDGSDIFEINEVLGRSFGGGDNPLLTGGLALTMFSMEALKGFPHSIRYAKMIFRYIESSEISPGFLYRRTGSHTKDASTDELLGVVLGLYYYKKALDAGVVDHSALEIQRVVSIASNIGKLLKRHGYYYLPESSDFQRIYKICEYVQLGRQRAYPFGHPLRITLEHITGESYPAKWDEYEFFYYFGHSPLDPRRLSDFPRPIFSSALEHVEAQVLKFESEVDLIPGIEKPNVTHWEFFELVLKALKNGQTVTKALNDIVSTLINTSIFYATFGVGNIIFGDEFDDLIPNVDEADTFNFVMVGEACIPLLDLYRQGSYQYNCELISSCFQSLMSLPGREENSFFCYHRR